MERRNRGEVSQPRSSRCRATNKLDYCEVGDQELLSNQIRLGWPPQACTARDLPKSSSAPYPRSSGCPEPPKCPPREIQSNPGPAVNRSLKPSRRRASLDKSTQDLASHLSGLKLQKAFKQDALNSSRDVEFSPVTEGLKSHESQRHSLDLDTGHHTDKRSLPNFSKKDKAAAGHQNHEWPQTREDLIQNDFVAKEKPQTSYYEDDWYVGTCNRTDAEHALHLVNKDGAFLVRDCSKNTSVEPFVLAVYHEKRVYNVKIRFVDHTNKYSLGTGQRAKDMFDSVADIIKFHSIFPIILINGRNKEMTQKPRNCVLTCPITKKDVDQLLE